MADVVEAFFSDVSDREHRPLVAKVSGTVRFEVVDGGVETWMVTLDRGDVHVGHGDGEPDCTIRADRALFERLCRGEENAFASVLRGALQCSGEVELLFAVQRLFPGPPGERSAGPDDAPSEARS